MQLRISDGEDAAEIEASVKALVNNGWSLREDRLLEKKYYFKNYSKVMDCHTAIGIGSKAKNHHAPMTTNFGSLAVSWTTHEPPGLSAKDIFMAKHCDSTAALIGTVKQSEAPNCGHPHSSQM